MQVKPKLDQLRAFLIHDRVLSPDVILVWMLAALMMAAVFFLPATGGQTANEVLPPLAPAVGANITPARPDFTPDSDLRCSERDYANERC